MRILTSLLSAALVTLAGVAQAQENFQGLESIGKPEPKGMGFQFPATELMRDLVWLDNFLLVIITVISVFVTCLLAYAAFKFHRSRNDTPGTFHSITAVFPGKTYGRSNHATSAECSAPMRLPAKVSM